MKSLFFFIPIFFVLQVPASPVEIQRTDGSMIRFYFEKPQVAHFPVLIVLQGSVCSSSFPLVQMAARVVGRQAGVIAVEKYGLNEGTSDCPRAYLENNTVDGRILDHLQVVAYLRRHEPGWNGVLGWAGGSEGGQVAALTAPLVPETKLIVMLASGGGLEMAEELPMATTRAMQRAGADPEAIQRAIGDLRGHFQVIRNNPTPDLEWLSDGRSARNTYKWWNSILWKKSLPLLEMMDVPIYLAHGTEDTSCPVESSDAVSRRFQDLGKQNLTYRRYPGLEHDWSDLSGVSHAQQVLGDAFSWILQNLKSRKPFASDF